MAQGIETLIKLHKRELDTLRRELVRKEEQKESLIQLATKLHHELMRERELAAEQPTMAAYMGDYEKRIAKRQLAIAQDVIQVDGDIMQLSAAIAERFGELKKYEITRDNRIERERAAEATREQIMMDELGAQQFSRKKDEKKS